MFEQVDPPKVRSMGYKIMACSAVAMLLGFGLCGGSLLFFYDSRSRIVQFVAVTGSSLFLIGAAGLILGVIWSVVQHIRSKE